MSRITTRRRLSLGHTGTALAARYARGALPEGEARVVDRHLESCARCAATVSAQVSDTSAGAALAAVRENVLRSAREPGARSRAARAPARTAGGRPGPGGGTWPLLPSPAALTALRAALRPGWWGALLLLVGGTLALGWGAGFTGARPVLLALAPVLPLAGVALAYGPYADPLHELALSTPRGGLRLLLSRTAVLSLVSLPPLTAVGAVLPSTPGAPGAAAWLLPALALTSVTLSAGSYVNCRTAAAGCAAGWAVALTLPAGPGGPLLTGRLAARLALLLDGPAAQSCWAALALCAAALVTLRRRAYARL